MPLLSFNVRGHAVSVESENGSMTAKAGAVEATDKTVAADIATEIFDLLVVALSFDLQGRYPNSHNGHPRFSWRRRELRIFQLAPREGLMIDGSLAIKSIYKFPAERTQAFLSTIESNPILAFLVTSYYQALGPLDTRSKFYNAFLVVEFVERLAEEQLPIALLLDPKLLEPSISIMRAYLSSHGLDRGEMERIICRSLGQLRTATRQSRQTKLLQFLKEKLQITSVFYAGQEHPVDDELIKNVIEQRNRLFHAASKDDQDVKKLTDLLILLVEKLLTCLLERAELTADA
jgi:hypothetical protein